jgi:hypothetical protein
MISSKKRRHNNDNEIIDYILLFQIVISIFKLFFFSLSCFYDNKPTEGAAEVTFPLPTASVKALAALEVRRA